MGLIKQFFIKLFGIRPTEKTGENISIIPPKIDPLQTIKEIEKEYDLFDWKADKTQPFLEELKLIKPMSKFFEKEKEEIIQELKRLDTRSKRT
ncbi:MAG: hypothetical protein ACKVQC_00455 [Elusimicrobiota bacterium]